MRALFVSLPLRFTFLALALSGCNQKTPKQTERLLENPWTPVTKSAEQGLAQQRAYCYSTLGDPECYKRRQEVMGSRLKGYYAPQEKEQPPVQHEKTHAYAEKGIDV